MLPWAIWTVLLAAINLTLFVAIRGRWGGEAPVLVVAAVVGEYHLLGAVVGAQLALIATGAVSALVAGRAGSTRRRDGAGPGR